MHISVVIPHLNQPDALARCLASVMSGTRAPDEVIVVDNGSATLPTVPANVTLLQENTPGPGPARNLGVTYATGDILAFIDADCLADPNWLKAASTALQSHDILGGDVRIAYTDPQNITAIEAYESIYAFRMDRYIAREGFTGTGNLVVKAHVLDSVGPFAGLDIAEDRDWGQRATSQGHKIHYTPDMRVYHPARQTMDDLRAKWDRHMAHDYAETPRAKWLIKTAAMILSPLFEIPRIVTSDRLQGITNKLRALMTLTRIRAYRTKRMAQLAITANPSTLASQWNRS